MFYSTIRLGRGLPPCALLAALLGALFGCSDSTTKVPAKSLPEGSSTQATAPAVGSATTNSISDKVTVNSERNAYFGDLHVHTRFSFDAFLMGTRRTPDDAYLFAKGDAIEHASGFMMQMKKTTRFSGRD